MRHAFLVLPRRSIGKTPHSTLGRDSRGHAFFIVVLPVLFLASLAFSATTKDQNLSLKIPPVRTSLKIEDQPITITASGLITLVSADQNQAVLKLELVADFSDLQQNATALLRSQLNKDDRCGERISIQRATLNPAEPASLVSTQFHYERWTCAKALGKQINKRLVAGNGLIEMKLTPKVENDHTVRLVPEVGKLEADGSVGELLRSGPLGAMLREKIQSSIHSAMQKGTNLSATLPPAVQGLALIQNAEFKDAGSGHLAVALGGEIHISKQKIEALEAQLKERVPR